MRGSKRKCIQKEYTTVVTSLQYRETAMQRVTNTWFKYIDGYRKRTLRRAYPCIRVVTISRGLIPFQSETHELRMKE